MTLWELSHAQKRIWYAQQKYPGSPLFSIGGMAIAASELETSTLENAIVRLVRTQQALRLRFREENGAVFQYVDDTASPLVSVQYFSASADGEDALRAWCLEQAARPMEILETPLYSFAILCLGGRCRGYFVKLHHLIADGWSMKLLTEYIAAAYRRLSNEPDGTSPDYTAYLLTEKERESGDAWKRDRAFWTGLFAEGPPAVVSRPHGTKATRRTFFLPKALDEKMRVFLGKTSLSLNSLFVGLYMLYRYKIYGEYRPVVGIPLLGRSGRRERETFGNYTNTMPFIQRISSEDSLEESLLSVSDGLRQCLAHQQYPYDCLKKEIAPDGAGIGLYDVCVNCYNTNLQGQIGGIPYRAEEIFNGEQEYALQIILREWGEETLQLDFDYRLDAYTDQQIETLFQRLIRLLSLTVDKPDSPLRTISLLSRSERKTFLEDFNATAAPYPKGKTAVALFEDLAFAHPERRAVSVGSQNTSYAALSRLVYRYAGYMQQNGVKSGDVVALLPAYTTESVAAILAILLCGGVYMPLDAAHPAERLEHLLIQAKAKHLIMMEDSVRLRFSGSRFSLPDRENDADIPFARPTVACPYAYLIFTSGSSGEHKGVRIRHDNLMNYLWWAKQTYCQNGEETFALYSSFAFDFTMTSLFLPLIHGGAIRLYGGGREENIFQKILTDRQTTTLKITPSHIPLVLDVPAEGSAVHTLILGGEALKTKSCENLYRHFGGRAVIYNEYGPTEATVGCMIHRYDPRDPADASVPIGRPISNTRIYLLDRDRQPVPPEATGDIYIGGDGLAEGYYIPASTNSDRFLPDPFMENTLMYHSGDMARWVSGDRLVYLGRRDDQVKLRGNRVELREVEQAVQDSGLVRDAKAVVRTEKGHDELILYLIPDPAYKEETLRRCLSERLPSYMCPAYYCTLSHFPLTVNGKADIMKFPPPERPRPAAVPESLPLFWKELAADVQALCPDERLETDTNFYAAGGDSIKAIQLSSRLKEQGLELSVRDILVHPVLSEMAGYIVPAVPLPEQGLCEGEIPVTPVWQWFFAHQFPRPGRYNQSLLLRLDKGITVGMLEEAFAVLVRHHDLLRLNIHGEKADINHAHLEREWYIWKTSGAADAAFHPFPVDFRIDEDLLIRPCFVEENGVSYLRIIAHHLIVDGVSWRILLDDLAMLLRQAREQNPLRLSEKGLSYQQYAENLLKKQQGFAASSALWEEIRVLNGAQLLMVPDTACTYGEAGILLTDFEPYITPELLAKGSGRYQGNTGEFLLASLFRAVQTVFNTKEALFELEGHGRDRPGISPIERTVGWFTVLYPVHLRSACSDPDGWMNEIMGQCRTYGDRRYEWETIHMRDNGTFLRAQPIRFNYLGELRPQTQGVFTLEPFFPTTETAGENRFSCLFSVDSLFLGRRLHAKILFNSHAFSYTIIQRLADEWKKELSALLLPLRKRKNEAKSED